MRIAVFVPTPPWIVRSGLETVAFEQAKNLFKRGHEIDMICLGNGKRKETVDGVGVIYSGLKLRTSFMPLNHMLNSLTHFFTSHIKIEGEYDIFYVHKGIFLPLIKKHAPSVKYSYGEFPHWSPVTVSNILIDLFDLSLSERIIACSEYARNQLVGFGFKSIDVITPGTYVHKFKPGMDVSDLRKKYSLDSKVVVFVGRVTPSKGCTELLDIMTLIKTDFKLLLVGKYDMNYAKSLLAGAKKLGIEDKLVFVGEKSYYDLPKYYNLADIQVLPSPIEAFGMVNIEAQSCGIPSIAYDVGGVGSSINNKKSGFLVKPGDKAEFAQKIDLLLENDCVRKRMGRYARKLAVRNFDWSIIAKKTENIFKKVV